MCFDINTSNKNCEPKTLENIVIDNVKITNET